MKWDNREKVEKVKGGKEWEESDNEDEGEEEEERPCNIHCRIHYVR